MFRLILTAAGCTCCGTPEESIDDEQAVRAAAAAFYVALNALFTGDVAPMKKVWSHGDDVTYMGPAGGLQVGWGQVRANWETQAAKKLGGAVLSEGMRITMSGNLAVVGCYEKGANVDAHGQPRTVSIRATSSFRKIGGQWKMVGHHTDLLEFLEE